MISKRNGKGTTLCISRGRIRAHMCKIRTAGTFFPETPDNFYVFLSGNVCFRRGKRTFRGRETYVSPDGNIDNLKATENYLTGISSIRNAWRGKNGVPEKNKWDAYKEEQVGAYRKDRRKQLKGKLTEKRTNKKTTQQPPKNKTSRTDIKKGVPLNSNLC